MLRFQKLNWLTIVKLRLQNIFAVFPMEVWRLGSFPLTGLTGVLVLLVQEAPPHLALANEWMRFFSYVSHNSPFFSLTRKCTEEIKCSRGKAGAPIFP